MNPVKKKKMSKQKSNSATIGFWLVLGASKEHSLVVCPSLISEEATKDINEISIEKVWKLGVQIPFEQTGDPILVMIPEIINIANLDKPVSEYKNLWEIQTVRAKCESLATKYIEQFRSANK